jgi:hypothetical protein
MARFNSCSRVVLVALMCVSAPAAHAQEVLQNTGFETGVLTPWTAGSYPAAAGSLVIAPATRTGTRGAWIYTAAVGAAVEQSFSEISQDAAASVGTAWTARAWARTPALSEGGAAWIAGAHAFLRVAYLNASRTVVLESFESERLTEAGQPFRQLAVDAPAAPEGTAWVRFILRVQKPSGVNGQAVVAFDDSSLTLAGIRPRLGVSRGAIGFGSDLDAVSLQLANRGAGSLFWQFASLPPWLSASPASGGIGFGGIGSQTVTLTLNRALLPAGLSHAAVTLSSDGGNATVDVFADQLADPRVPGEPSIVRVSGRQLIVQRRLPDGGLALPQPLTMVGVAWSPASVGTTADIAVRQQEFGVWFRSDIALMRRLGVNVVRVYLHPTLVGQVVTVLDALYRHGIYALVAADLGLNDTAAIDAVVPALRNHPALLGFVLGNEWNLPENRYYGVHPTVLAAAQATEAAARRVKALDPRHPVTTVLADVAGGSPTTEQIVRDLCPSIDYFGLNVYRGVGFGAVFDEWQALSTKPVWIAELGTDSFWTQTPAPVFGYVDEAAQRDRVLGLWAAIRSELSSIAPAGRVLGGTVFSFVDEWNKVLPADGGDFARHDVAGRLTTWNPAAHPDGFANEEYFGLVDIDRRPRLAFDALRLAFALTLDGDADGLPSTWELTFGLDPGSAIGDAGAAGDPDGDGRTNLQEYLAATHPRGTSTRYLAEGVVNAFFRTEIALLNPGAAPANTLVRIQPQGESERAWLLTTPPHSRRTLGSDLLSTLSGGPFSSVIESDAMLVADRTVSWGAGEYGAHAEVAVSAPALTWYLAEGSTSGDFALFYLLQNPNAFAVTAVVRYLLPLGQPPIDISYSLPPTSRTSIAVDAASPALASTDVSAAITASAPIIVERAMYLNRPNQPFAAGHGSAGVTAPALEWFFAEGATGPFFELFLLVANPGSVPASIEVDYLLLGGQRLTRSYLAPAQGRFSIWVDEEEIPAGSGVRPLAEVAVSARVRSTNNVPIIVERAMWWPAPDWYEAHNSAGATTAGTRWALAGGETGGTRGVETYVLIANTSTFAGVARVTAYFEDGTSASIDQALPAESRTNVAMSQAFPGAVNRTFGIVIESTGAPPAQLVVERAMYWSTGEGLWSAGTAVLATRLAP